MWPRRIPALPVCPEPLNDRLSWAGGVGVRQRDVRAEAIGVLGHVVRPPPVGDRRADHGA